MSYGLRVGPRVRSVRVEERHIGRVFTIRDIRRGWAVVDVEGEDAGTVQAAGEAFLAVRRGLLSACYVPYRAVAAVRDGLVLLNVPAQRLADWGARPRSGL